MVAAADPSAISVGTARNTADTPQSLAEMVLASARLTMQCVVNLILNPSPNGDRAVNAAFAVLEEWYAAHSAVRRLWAISESEGVRVIVSLEPTRDGDDIYPAWLANGRQWTQELQLRLGGSVRLEVTEQPYLAESPSGVDGVLVAELFWRDSST
jgi:hypothetical protein